MKKKKGIRKKLEINIGGRIIKLTAKQKKLHDMLFHIVKYRKDLPCERL